MDESNDDKQLSIVIVMFNRLISNAHQHIKVEEPITHYLFLHTPTTSANNHCISGQPD
jgi:hypothetical protein